MSGLEIASFAVSSAVKIEQLTEFLIQGIREAANFGRSVEKERLSLELEASTFKSIKCVLFGHSTSFSEGLFSLLSQHTQVDILNVLRLFRDTLEAKYQLVDKIYNVSQPSARDVLDDTIVFGSYHSISLVRKVRWGFTGKAKIEKTTRELHSWNEKLMSIIQLQMICQALDISPTTKEAMARGPSLIKRLHESEIAGDADSLGLRADLRLADLTRPNLNVDADTDGGELLPLEPIEMMEIAGADVKFCGEDRCIVEMNRSSVLVEFKRYDPGQDGKPHQASLLRVSQLANILRVQKPDRYRTLLCKEYFVDIETKRFGLCFEIPPSLRPQYNTLFSLLHEAREPDLEARFHLARQLASALSQFHCVGWIHKSFRSNNIIFFSPSYPVDETSLLTEPYIFGWEYSRPELEFSSRPVEVEDIDDNVYRHPDQWGHPTVSFTKVHDVYALGVILLEIGLWKQAKALHRSGFRNPPQNENQVRQYLLETAKHRRLSAAMGTRYQKIVMGCLEGSLGSSPQAASLAKVETFKDEVIDALDDIIQGLSG